MTNSKKAIRVLCLQPSSIFENYGGAEYYFDDLLTGFANLVGGANIKTLVPKRSEGFRFEKRSYQIEAVQFKRKGIFRKIENRYSSDFFWTALATIHEFKPTLILCGHVHLAPLTLALSRLTHTPYYCIALGIECWGNLLPQDEFALRRAKGIVSISNWTKNILIQRGYSAERIQIIHPSVTSTFENLPQPVLSKESKKFTLLTLSRLDSREQYKGHDHVLAALKLLKNRNQIEDIQYIIQGNGPDRDRLKRLTSDYGLDSVVQFRDAVKTRDELIQTYRQANLFIMPSRFGRIQGQWRGEGFGIVFVEAGLLGVPSIAYDCGGATDIIENEKSGLLVPMDNIENLAHRIRYAVDHPKIMQTMGQAAYERSKRLFCPNSMKEAIRHFLSIAAPSV